jgi:nicotinamidase-related amidase
MANNSSALLIIDVQIGLVELMSAEVQSRALPKIKTLLTEARASGIPVIYIQHDGAQGHPLETHTEGWEIYPSLKPAEGGASSESGNRTHFSEPCSNRNLKKERLPISSLREA